MFQGIVIAWQVLKWMLNLRRNLETKGSSLITTEKCLGYRLWLERLAHALETGNMKGLPAIVQWLFKNTKLDNELGRAGKDILKSKKLEDNSPSLYRMH